MKIVISRKEAKALGLKTYYTGKPCKYGHIAERGTCDGACRECGTIRSRTAERKAYRQTEERQAYQRAYKQTAEGKASQQKTDRKKYEKNPHHFVARYIRAKYPTAIIPLTEAEQTRVATLYRLAAGLRKRTGEEWDVDHCFPLGLGGVHHPDNLMILPAAMNRSKNNKFNEESPAQVEGLFVSMMAKAIYHPLEQQCSPFQ